DCDPKSGGAGVARRTGTHESRGMFPHESRRPATLATAATLNVGGMGVGECTRSMAPAHDAIRGPSRGSDRPVFHRAWLEEPPLNERGNVQRKTGHTTRQWQYNRPTCETHTHGEMGSLYIPAWWGEGANLINRAK